MEPNNNNNIAPRGGHTLKPLQEAEELEDGQEDMKEAKEQEYGQKDKRGADELEDGQKHKEKAGEFTKKEAVTEAETVDLEGGGREEVEGEGCPIQIVVGDNNGEEVRKVTWHFDTKR